MDFGFLGTADIGAVLAGAFAFALGGLLKGATGAGAPVVIVPVIALFYDVPTAVVMFAIPNLLTNVWQGWVCRHALLPGTFPWLFGLGGFSGAVAGTLLLAKSNPDALSLAMAGVVFVYIAFRLFRPLWQLDRLLAQRVVLPVGLIAGMLQGSTGISAPVSITFVSAMRLPRQSFMAVMSIYFLSLASAQIPFMLWLDLMDGQLAFLGTAAVLPMIAGMPVGAWLARHISASLFDRIILILLACIALRLVWSAQM